MAKKSDVIYGTRAIIETIKSGKEIDKVLIRKGLRNPLFYELQELLKNYKVPMQFVPIEKLNRITTKNHQGTIAYVSAVTYQEIEDIIPFLYEEGKTPLIMILDSVTDVRNMGAIVRTLECAGGHAVVVPAKGTAQINADAIKASAGALNIIPVCRSENLKDTIEFLKESGLHIVSANEKSEQNYTSMQANQPLAIIMGSEDRGVSEEYLKRSDTQVQIPILGEIDSLNVSVAAAVLLYEVVKQRSK